MSTIDDLFDGLKSGSPVVPKFPFIRKVGDAYLGSEMKSEIVQEYGRVTKGVFQEEDGNRIRYLVIVEERTDGLYFHKSTGLLNITQNILSAGMREELEARLLLQPTVTIDVRVKPYGETIRLIDVKNVVDIHL